jgi:hypothetical protein
VRQRGGGYNSDMTRRAFVAVLLIFPAVCLAWGGEGHQIVALIAEDHLTPRAKAAVTELLDGAHISDAEVASWADEVRRQRSNTAPWHYVNIPHDAGAFDQVRDGNNVNNVIDAIDAQLKVLADKAAPREKRQEALKFVVHFMGDIHQPLHCADRNGDKGGNKRLVFFLDRRKAVSLHSVWGLRSDSELKWNWLPGCLRASFCPKSAPTWSAGKARGEPLSYPSLNPRKITG